MSDLCSLARCPHCRGTLLDEGTGLRCSSCASSHSRESGILDLRGGALDETLAYDQASYYDHDPNPEWEIEWPSTAPALYEWLMREKFGRSISHIRPVLEGATVLTVCGGSGMDAEFLAAAGATVISSDISQEAGTRAQERSRRHGVPFEALAADVYNLPFEDGSIDIVYVHDGLHHLEHPLDGLAEMARVARRAVSVTEPALARLTQGAVRLGIAEEVEDAGNRVERLRPEDVVTSLAARGFRPVHVARYGMFYRHEPGPAMRLLSAPPAFAATTAALTIANRIVGRFGNKLTVQAVREESR